MRLFQTVDMRGGNPVSQIVRFSIPMLLGNIAQQLYSTVDSVVVGRYVGDNALAAVGSAAPIINLLLVLFIGVSMGATIMVSQFLGARDREGLGWSVGTILSLEVLAGVVFGAGCAIFSRQILGLLNTPPEAYAQAVWYLRICMLGTVFVYLYNLAVSGLDLISDNINS